MPIVTTRAAEISVEKSVARLLIDVEARCLTITLKSVETDIASGDIIRQEYRDYVVSGGDFDQLAAAPADGAMSLYGNLQSASYGVLAAMEVI